MNEFTKVLIDRYNSVAGAVVAILTAVFGAYWYIFVAYMALNIIDWLTGWANAHRQKKESSRIRAERNLQKAGILGFDFGCIHCRICICSPWE